MNTNAGKQHKPGLNAKRDFAAFPAAGSDGDEAQPTRERHRSVRSSPSDPVSTNAGKQHISLLNASRRVAAFPAAGSDGGEAQVPGERHERHRSSPSDP
jgi:hypothetical protein